ncbi:uncharacterized protein ACLA_032070 [Aspergillus clavatus NRRL 1]|uniref:Uncharacterized protein n=1 Tax=Aspergillus clavatus (strain ATCC 1007 / CBS 513.65 / DSM 816 / NCTC 3887 / NRRL 1 / QM 1276 / 107) TaxID=344612 RepID=A1CS51_ASPCL|nr:uncharacterized protein ACLA_032070 [Aspergillus clavatus NRRL 1]EAW08472.1 conserved hypothetical protein [Aspergillus clavatus NRRL 1]
MDQVACLPAEHRSGLTPQSRPIHHYSASMSKPTVLLDQEPVQLPTPNQSGPIVMPDDESGSPQDFSGRGKRLTLAEQKSLFRLCETYMNRYDASEYPKRFWIKISDLLLKSTGRKYSWQSCRRRIQQYVEKRKAFWAAFDADKTLPDLGDMDEDLASDIDDWMTRCEKRLEKEEKERRDKAYQAEIEQAELARSLKLQRTFDWANGLPPPEEMELQPDHWGLPPHRFVVCDGQLLQGIPLAHYLCKKSRENHRLALVAAKLQSDPDAPPVQDQKPEPAGEPGNHPIPNDRKRPREDDPADLERPAQRPCLAPEQLPQPIPGDPSAEKKKSAGATMAQKNVDRLVNNLWLQFAKGIAPYYEEHRNQPQTNRQFGLVLYDLYRDLGHAFNTAVNRLSKLDYYSEEDESISEDVQ